MTIPRTLLSISAFLSATCLAGCSDAPPSESELTTSEAAAPALEIGAPVTSLGAIKGFWLVERFEEFSPDWREGVGWRSAYVQVNADGLAYSVGCNHSSNPATLGEDGILREAGDGSRIQTLMGCPAEWEGRDGRFFGFFGTNPTVNRVGESRLLLKSGATELVLVEPEAWRLANIPDRDFVTGKWVPQMASTYDGWGHSGFGIGENAGVVTIAAGNIEWSECPGTSIEIEWTADGRLRNRDGAKTRCDALARNTDNGRSLVMGVLSDSPAVIRIGKNRITLIVGTSDKGSRLDMQTLESVMNPPKLPPPPPGEVEPPPPPPIPINS
ncbi:hypothetical protein GRI34_05640 [Erythrobacter aquimaris]|uniref:META domain-containing protein n=1 Tax=Qipengyuania aquimaris TaxID=255984 RepID=A0A6I4TJ54_9SPHN|nr:hypothetical protein [Qipengyuania aquimaris]MXO95904.1 hypothetical protein [Qipengyuania aquimaris]